MPNDEFVSRQWLIDEYHRRHEGPPGGALKMIEEAPAADVVPAPVHCSECRFYDKRDGGAPGGTGWCSRPGAGCGVPEEFFCAGAERKEDNDESGAGGAA